MQISRTVRDAVARWNIPFARTDAENNTRRQLPPNGEMQGGPAEVHQLAQARTADPSTADLDRQHYLDGTRDDEPGAGSSSELKPWQEGKFRFSSKNFYGSPWTGAMADGKEHLVPEEGYIVGVLALIEAVKKLIASKHDLPWFRVWHDEMSEPDTPLHELYVDTSATDTATQQTMVDRIALWIPRSRAIRTAFEDSMVRYALALYDLQEIKMRMNKMVDEGQNISDAMLNRKLQATAWCETQLENAKFNLALWMDERETTRSILSNGIADSPEAARIEMNPDSIELRYALVRQCIFLARREEAQVPADAGAMTAEATKAENLEHLPV